MEFLALIAGLAGLWLGTEAAIKGAVALAERVGISEFVIGVAILSVGSDLPELAIAVDAAIRNLQGGDASDLVVGSALGSSMGQIGFVLGIAALVGHLVLPKHTIYKHGSVLLGSIILVALFGYDGVVTRTEGLSLIVVYVLYLVFLLADALGPLDDHTDGPRASILVSILYVVVGLAIVTGSAELTVRAATSLATTLGIEQAFVAIIIIGLGSSLPELSISLVAVLKNRVRLSVGNLVGSNVFDTLIPIGVAAAITRLDFDAGMLRVEVPFLFILTFFVLLFFRWKRGIQKVEAIVILALYVGYASYKFATAPI